MRRFLAAFLLPTLALLALSNPAPGQHPAARHTTAAAHVATHPAMTSGTVQPHMTAQQQKQVQQQQQAMQKEMQRQMQLEMKQQQAMIQEMQKHHQEHMNHFNEWTKQQQKAMNQSATAGGSSASGTGATAGGSSASSTGTNASGTGTNASGTGVSAGGKGATAAGAVQELPTFSSQQQMQTWLNQQKHLKATKRTYNLGYDRYIAYLGYLQNVRNLVNNLHSARQLIAPLKDNYEGHRVVAMNHIGGAISSLHNSAIGPAPTLGSTGGTSSALSQAYSDDRMRRALVKLQAIQSHLTLTSGIPNHLQARQYVEGAMEELNTALTIR
jgi:hypothetical protein